VRSIVNFPTEQNHRSSVGAACTFTRGKLLFPLREGARQAANRAFHIFLEPERARLSGPPEPFIDEAMEYLGQEYVKTMNEDLPVVTMSFPTIRLTARATPAASASFREETE
jgi:hypothetical protein